ncbi:alanine aminotransferase 2-like [Lycorma delicatula]|uniref:alanine aminotransferase 2-like n=1 Tax=Lycorma delicatula TaxID=130591 RepID=UPI003F516192
MGTYYRTFSSKSSNKKSLTIDTLNPGIKILEYAVRGPIAIRASEIEKELQKGIKKPFNEVIKAHIGDCHAMGQTPITFIRQVLAVVSWPKLLDNPEIPSDVKFRAVEILRSCAGYSIGSYPCPLGVDVIRNHVVCYIEKRDGHPCNLDDVVLHAGAKDGIQAVLDLFDADVDGKRPGIMCSIPQYPLYSAIFSKQNMTMIKYYLNEDKNWSLEIPELERAIEDAKKTCYPRAIVVINPGNPTGQVLTRENIEAVIKFAYENNLFILADEVYQHNIYDKNCKFFSFKKVLMEMGEPYNKVELASIMSTSKGYMGECGMRGGYSEVINLDPDVKAMFFKSLYALYTPSVLGQACLDAIVNPPELGEPSYELFSKEKEAVLQSLAIRAKMVTDTFNNLEGISCNPVQGAMYAFPKINLPPKAIEKARSLGQSPDVFYTRQLLEETGISVVPGSGFGQKPGTNHFRTTTLPLPEKLTEMLQRFKEFHESFMAKYK